MKFSEYMEKYNKTLIELAKELDSSTGYLHDLRTGRRKPSLAMIIKIQEYTKNKVKAADWISDKAPESAQAAKKGRKPKPRSDQE